MRSTTRRILATTVAIGALAVGATSALAAGTMPAANPIDYASLHKTAAAQVFNVTIKGSDLGGDAMTKTVTNGLMGGMGATITVQKATTKGFGTYQTVTVKPTTVGEVTSTIATAYATQSGGNIGTQQIASTTQTSKAFTVKLAWPGSEGTSASLNLKFYLLHS